MNENAAHTDQPETTSPAGRPWATALAVLGCLARLAPHPWHFTPAGAAGLLAGARLSLPRALALSLGTWLVVDITLAAVTKWPFFHGALAFVYAAVILNVLIGRWLIGRSNSPVRIGAASLLATAQFFLLTNFGVWLASALSPAQAMAPYPPTLAGLAACYAAAVPFLRWTLLGDLLFSGILFAAHAWLTARAPAPAAVTEAVGRK